MAAAVAVERRGQASKVEQLPELRRRTLDQHEAAGAVPVEDDAGERIDELEVGHAGPAHVDDERLHERARSRAGRGHDDLLPLGRRRLGEVIAGRCP